MKKRVAFLLSFLLLAGCSGPRDPLKAGMALRGRLLQSSACCFDAGITADYGDQIHIFRLHCQADEKGDMVFTVVEPESISGIGGKLSGEGGELTFDDTALHFELMAQERLSPVSAPWVLLRTLRGGCITSAGEEEGKILLSIDDSYQDDPLRLDIRLNDAELPEHADILYDGRRILSVSVDHFEIS